ncbi:DEAD/DEAH box helicase family protein [Candidatus Dojkabacteria bacterium]|uniref:DEAD/DEAH box helicase family protein n=1 Tax=Candidatus Dojkabacteria bacterium TaxID=2099670 RepID=A0A955IFA8_9BACT|nr:DEAD/DEAH box helicase family protein [Candidatus Dojkabacteria bacterium]
MSVFNLHSQYQPSGDQPLAIDYISAGIEKGIKNQTIIGATGTGKTFTMANIIQNVSKPTIILSHNKTLAAQLFSEMQEFFPENKVSYFVSYYDYYQPEAYVPSRDLYIEKDSDINETIERYRNTATQNLLSERDVIIVATVSCIYGLGNPEDYGNLSFKLSVGDVLNRDRLFTRLGDLQYERRQNDFSIGTFRVRGEIVDINLFTADDRAVRLEFFGDELESIKLINPISGEFIDKVNEITIFPAKHYATSQEKLNAAIKDIERDLEIELKELRDAGKIIEEARLKQRVMYDLEMIQETGFTKGIENYSRYIDRRAPGTAGACLLDYFPDDYLMFIDESHITVPQIGGMYEGDRSRKTNLVDYGFRMKAALDNRPLKFEEFRRRLNQVVYVSATPKDYEISLSKESAREVLK